MNRPSTPNPPEIGKCITQLRESSEAENKMKKLEASQEDVADDGTRAKKANRTTKAGKPRAQNEPWRRKIGSNISQKKGEIFIGWSRILWRSLYTCSFIIDW